ncbi:neuronal calcium sensor 1-like isoform X2 [Gordionus sp. m RMFG-2023]|uniref:neuronal calcium sensor 1-like isoform X2 n=1 Tax=Gordionus sp. m RMFG-2023 TaxID=3053472 RepID=UPI0031FD1167
MFRYKHLPSFLVNRKEINEWYENYIRECPDGKLHKKEFQKMYTQFFPEGNSTQFSEIIFDVFDENKDGYLNFREFILSLSIISRGTSEEKLDWAFSMYDLNRDNYITQKEMMSIIMAIYDMLGHGNKERKNSQDKIKILFRDIDTNKDGKISKEEFIKFCRNDPSIMETLSLNFFN